jgi:hypothetical protein
MCLSNTEDTVSWAVNVRAADSQRLKLAEKLSDAVKVRMVVDMRLKPEVTEVEALKPLRAV